MSVAGLNFRRKLALLVMAASGVALLLASACFVYHDVSEARGEISQGMQTDAEHIAQSCEAALRFGDSKTAQESLAVLAGVPNVILAAVYDADGRIFASYCRDAGQAVPARAPALGARVGRSVAEVSRAVPDEVSRAGTVYIRRDLADISERLWYDAKVVGGVLVASLGLALAGTGWFQRRLTRPIQELVQTADAVARTRNYSLRARKLSGDELAVLTEQFNSMLDGIQRRDQDLQRAHAELEKRVSERTQELQSRTEELDRLARAAVGREERMVELKRQINGLAVRLGDPPRYNISFADQDGAS